jgi:hypothetical protein
LILNKGRYGALISKTEINAKTDSIKQEKNGVLISKMEIDRVNSTKGT